MSNPYKITLQLPAAVANGIALSQSRGSAGALAINGSLATGGVATLSSAKCPATRVQIVSAGNDSALVWTITGLNRYGLVHSETLAGANAGAANSVYDYATVTSIVSSGATASTVTAGTNGVASTEWRVQDFFREKFSVACYIGISGVANCQVEYTADDPNAALPGSLLPNSNQPPVAYLHGTLNNLSMNATGNFNDLPAFAIRLTVNSGTGAVTMTLIQSGIGS